MLPDIDSLALFVRAADLHSLTKAAEASHIGLAAASRRIAALEHRFQTPLFERKPRGVELTASGHTLLTHAKTLLARLNQLEADMGSYKAGRKGVLRMLANTSSMAASLPKDLAAFTRRNPEISLVVEEQWSLAIVEAVMRGDVDLGVIIDGVRSDGLDVFPYREDRMAVVVPADHELLGRSVMSYEDVLEHKLITLESGCSLVRVLTEQAVALQKPLHLHVQVKSFESICRMVEAGLGVGVLPLEAAGVLTAGMDLVVLPLRESWARLRMLICVKSGQPVTAPLAAMIHHLSARQFGVGLPNGRLAASSSVASGRVH